MWAESIINPNKAYGYENMNCRAIWGFVNDTLQQFYLDFSRDKSYRLFVVVIIGLMIRTKYLGVTSIVRDLCINPAYYESFLMFFRASSWTLQGLKTRRMKAVASCGFIIREGSLNILIWTRQKNARCKKIASGIGGQYKSRLYFRSFLRGTRRSHRNSL